MEKLHSFSPSELVVMLCGEQCPQWTREDIMQYTEPKLGFTKDRSVSCLNISSSITGIILYYYLTSIYCILLIYITSLYY